MKVIKEIEQDGDLKGIVFYTNNVSENERCEVEKAIEKTYSNFFKTNKLTKEDLINLKRINEISTEKISGNLIKIDSNLSYEIKNILNDSETEWIMNFIIKYKGEDVFIGNNFEKSLEFLVNGTKLIDLILNCNKIELFDLYT